MEVSGQLHTPAALSLGEEPTPGVYWLGHWVGPKAGLESHGQETVSCLCRESNPGRRAA
jgi:hypothetical protein